MGRDIGYISKMVKRVVCCVNCCCFGDSKHCVSNQWFLVETCVELIDEYFGWIAMCRNGLVLFWMEGVCVESSVCRGDLIAHW